MQEIIALGLWVESDCRMQQEKSKKPKINYQAHNLKVVSSCTVPQLFIYNSSLLAWHGSWVVFDFFIHFIGLGILILLSDRCS